MITDTGEQGHEALISTAIAEHSYGPNTDSMKQPATSHVGAGWIVALNDKFPIARFTAEKLRALVSFMTSLNEQASIARVLRHAIHRIDQLTEKSWKSITLLREYHASLIIETVTGQNDIADWNDKA